MEKQFYINHASHLKVSPYLILDKQCQAVASCKKLIFRGLTQLNNIQSPDGDPLRKISFLFVRNICEKQK